MAGPLTRSRWMSVVLLAGALGGLGAGASVSWSQPAVRPLSRLLGPEGVLRSGQYMWADELVFSGWRIQRNTLNGAYRLLDAEERLHTTGSFDACRTELDKIRRERALPPLRPKVVLILHGLGDRRKSGQPLADFLEKSGEYQAFALGYPSLFEDLGPPAKSLASVIAHLDGVQEINLVGHSLGNLVIRQYYGDCGDPQAGRRPDPRLKRLVMLGPPNDGGRLIDAIGQSLPENEVISRVLAEFGRQWSQGTAHLGMPTCEFGIVAGGTGKPGGFNPLLPSDNDGLLEIATTRLSGASDFLVVPVFHAVMFRSPEVQRATLNFLQHGYFVSADRRQPIPGEAPPPQTPAAPPPSAAREF